MTTAMCVIISGKVMIQHTHIHPLTENNDDKLRMHA